MKRLMRLSLLILLISVSKPLFAQNEVFELFTDSIELRRQNDALINDFENRVRRLDNKFTLHGTRTIVGDSLYAGFYFPDDNRIHLPNWTTTPQPVLDFCNEVAGGKQEGEKLAAMYFYGFFLPHEIAHAFQFNAGLRLDNEYDNEFEASAIAVLYWKMRGKDVELKECYKLAKHAVSAIKDPFPAGVDEKKYFTDHYEEFAQDPYKYGYVMFKQIIQIFEQKKDKTNFDTYVSQRLSKK
jgi:hypothetical protein